MGSAKARLVALAKHRWYILLVFLPVAFTTYLVCTNGANVPYIDDWTMVPIFQHLHNGTWGVGDLWAQHYEHRIFFPNLVTVLLAQITHWNLFVEMLLNLVLTMGILLLLWRYIQKTARTRAWLAVAAIATSALLFSPVQWENWLWGWQIEWYMCMFFGIAALLLLDHTITWLTSRWRYALAAFCCIVATYSLGSGVFFWLACAVPLVLNRHSRRRVILWGALTLASTGLYFYRYHFMASSLSAPAEYVRFFFAYLGNALAHNIVLATVLGMLLIALTVAIIYVARYKQNISSASLALPFGLILFVLSSDAVTTFGRVPINGSEGALFSRYASISCLVIVAVILLLAQMRLGKIVWRTTVVLLLFLLLPNYVYGTRQLQAQGRYAARLEACLKQSNITDECLSHTYNDTVAARRWVAFLKQEHLGGF